MSANHDMLLLTARKDRLIAAARRHSRRVRFFKTALPLVGFAVAGAFSWFTFFSTTPAANILMLNGLDGANQLVMTHPKVAGYNSMGKPYSLSAARAVHEVERGDGIIKLQDIAAQMPLGERGMAWVEARSSIFDNVNGRMQFDQPFKVKTSDGIQADFHSANVNITSSQLTTRMPVTIRQSRTLLQAGTMQVLENGQIFVFGGGVRLLIANDTALP